MLNISKINMQEDIRLKLKQNWHLGVKKKIICYGHLSEKNIII